MKDTKIFITIIIIVIIIFGSVTQCPLEYDASLTRGSALNGHIIIIKVFVVRLLHHERRCIT